MEVTKVQYLKIKTTATITFTGSNRAEFQERGVVCYPWDELYQKANAILNQQSLLSPLHCATFLLKDICRQMTCLFI